MGKSLLQQRRGKGGLTFRARSHYYKAEVKHRSYDDVEKTSVMEGKIINLIHDPGHNAPLAQVKYQDNKTLFIFAPLGINLHDTIMSGNNASIKAGNTLPLKNIPEGTQIYNIESFPGDGGKFVRSPGTAANITSKTEDKVIILLPSKKLKELNPDCRATIGIIAGSGRKEKPFLKAGKKYHAMKARNRYYPTVSGVSMNVVSHPFGSGRGSHKGQSTTISRKAPPGRKVGLISARRSGRKK